MLYILPGIFISFFGGFSYFSGVPFRICIHIKSRLKEFLKCFSIDTRNMMCIKQRRNSAHHVPCVYKTTFHEFFQPWFNMHILEINSTLFNNKYVHYVTYAYTNRHIHTDRINISVRNTSTIETTENIFISWRINWRPRPATRFANNCCRELWCFESAVFTFFSPSRCMQLL